MPAKYQLIASELAERIRRGELGHRDKLPGELELAQEFAVSRGTVRQALATLAQHGLIETWTGSGSFVSYDGARLDDEKGWSEALARQGVPTRIELVALGRLELAAVAGRLGLASAEFLVVEQVRSTTAGAPISLERSRVPWRPSFETVLATGLVDDSLNATLAAHGLAGAVGTENVGVALLGSADAALLGRVAGEAFLQTETTVYDVFGNVVEYVTSLLDPQHFRLSRTFGRDPAGTPLRGGDR
ncbi:MAG TPA: GntR family transcriptional regulator [Pseudonocardia sp.]|nr:GntR family transcriptional regulator [Pseudonocardia sp.]